MIAGVSADAPGGRTIDARYPATGETIGRVAEAGGPDRDRVHATAQGGFKLAKGFSTRT